MNFNIDHLANETFEINKAFGHQISSSLSSDFDLLRKMSHTELVGQTDCLSDNRFPDSPGIIFWISKSIGTFCIRGFVADNLKDTYQRFHSDDHQVVNLFKKLKYDEEHSIKYFQTKTRIEAEILYSQILNKRLPFEEELLCNLSDPGFSWWLNETEDGFDIFFKSYGVLRSRQYLRLGPLGDPLRAIKTFNLSRSYFFKEMSIREFTATEKVFSIRVTNSYDKNLKEFKSVLKNGVPPSDKMNQEDDLHAFLVEMALIRRFWIFVEDLLS